MELANQTLAQNSEGISDFIGFQGNFLNYLVLKVIFRELLERERTLTLCPDVTLILRGVVPCDPNFPKYASVQSNV